MTQLTKTTELSRYAHTKALLDKANFDDQNYFNRKTFHNALTAKDAASWVILEACRRNINISDVIVSNFKYDWSDHEDGRKFTLEEVMSFLCAMKQDIVTSKFYDDGTESSASKKTIYHIIGNDRLTYYHDNQYLQSLSDKDSGD